MTDKKRLTKKLNEGTLKEKDLSFGRPMPFGKYQGKPVYHLLIKHPFYMDWVIKQTGFVLTETESWWKSQVDLAIEIARADRLIGSLPTPSASIILPNIDNPHNH